MAITVGQNGVASDFITKAERDATPANDSGRVAQMESNGRISEDHMETPGAVDIVLGEAFTGATTPQPAYINKTDNKAYLCDGNDATKYKFVGFIITTGSADATGRLLTSGLVRGFSGLDEGEKYYLSDTAGSIANAPGTQEVLVGVAVNSTTLLIMKGRRYASGAQAFSSTTTAVITLGFRPSIVRIHAVCRDADSHGQSHGSWNVKGGQRCVYLLWQTTVTTAAGARGDYAWYAYEDGAGTTTGNRGTVTTITDTGFTLDNTEEGTSTGVTLYWEAEGEL